MALQKVRRIYGGGGLEQPPRSRAFFMELVLNLFIFALCAMVALQVFAESKLTIEESAALSELSLDAQTLAEEYKLLGGELEALVLDGADAVALTNGRYCYYYDHNLEPTDAQGARYSLEFMQGEAQAGGMVDVIRIEAYAGEEQLFAFEASSYAPRGGS